MTTITRPPDVADAPPVARSDLWCEEHQQDPSEDLCGWCGRGYCPTCLVYPFGRRKPPYCLRCAVEASGVHHPATRRAVLTKADRRALAARRRRLATLERPPARAFGVELRPIIDLSV